MWKFCSRVADRCAKAAAACRRAVTRVGRAAWTAAATMLGWLGWEAAAYATDPPALNFTQIGVDPAELASQAAIALGGVVTVVIGFALLFIAARKSVRWFRGV